MKELPVAAPQPNLQRYNRDGALVQGLIRSFLLRLLHLGLLGPLFLGVLDSSFLFLPFGNDLLVIMLTIRDHQRLPLYVLTATLGSCIGVFLVDLVSRPGGDKGLKRVMERVRWEYLKRKITEHSAVTLSVACLAPPPFPFTLVIAASSASQYPRARLLLVVLAARAIRFSLVALLAVRFGREILAVMRSAEFIWFMTGLTALGLIWSVFQIAKWTRDIRPRRYAS